MDAENVADDRPHCAEQQDRELNIGEARRMNFPFGFFRDQIIGSAEKPEQEPNDQRVRMDHAHDIERHQLRKKIGRHVNICRPKAGDDLKDEQEHRSAEIGQRDFLTLIFHDGAPQPALFGGQS
jgi:hypothetical protein